MDQSEYQAKKESGKDDEEKAGLKKNDEGNGEEEKPTVNIDDFKFERAAKEEDIEEEEDDDSCWGRTIQMYNKPLFFIRNLTIPAFEEDKWDWRWAAVTPFFGSIFLAWQFGLIGWLGGSWIFWVILSVWIVSLTIIVVTYGRENNMAETHAGTMSFIAFVVSCMWINLIASLFMDYLSLLAIISGLPLNYLSLSLLAWGNSMDDFFVDYFVAKNGHGAMAVIGVFGGQIFNQYIGFGGSMFRQALRKTVVPNIFYLEGLSDNDLRASYLTILLLTFLIVGLVVTIVIAWLKEWHIGQRMFVFLLSYYVVFLVLATIISLIDYS